MLCVFLSSELSLEDIALMDETFLRNSYDKVTVRRSQVCEDTLEYFLQLEKLKQMDKIKSHLKVTFANEPGIDQGGLVLLNSCLLKSMI